MAFRSLSACRRLPAVRLVVLLAALTGLFAMHGLSDHGATHLGRHTVDTFWPSVVSGDGHQMSPGYTASTPLTQPMAQDATVDPALGDFVLGSRDAGSAGGGMGLVGLCLAVVGLIGLVSRALATQSRRSSWLVTHRGHGRLAVSGGLQIRTADPPHPYLLQVHRR